MTFPHAEPRLRLALALWAGALALAAAPREAQALRLLEEELSLAGPEARARPVLHVALAAQPPASPMDFDLLGTPSAPPSTAKEDARMRKRRQYLQWHQRVGLAIGTLEVATVVVGQLNYNDKFGTANTGRYELTHAVLAYTTFAAFAVGGSLALLAPRPKDKPSRGWDRMRVHKIGMALATAGMIAQAVYGIQTRNREGYLDQEQKAQTHLVIGYATLAASGVAVGALVF